MQSSAIIQQHLQETSVMNGSTSVAAPVSTRSSIFRS